MKVTIIGAGNSGLAMAAHLSLEGNHVTLWNRSRSTIEKLIYTKRITCEGVLIGEAFIDCVTTDIKVALDSPDIILITTPASSHKDLAELIGKNISQSTTIVLNPGRTFGALEFSKIYKEHNQTVNQIIAETQTIIYTCRKVTEDGVNIIKFKNPVPISFLNKEPDETLMDLLPTCLHKHFSIAESMVQTSFGNVGMVLHCAPILLNTGWTENQNYDFKYYHEGISPTIASFIEGIDKERLAVGERLGTKLESVKEWMQRNYQVKGDTLYECLQDNKAYSTINAPRSLEHRYVLEDVPCGLVPLEAIGIDLGIDMSYTRLIVDLASKLLERDFRKNGRNLENLGLLQGDSLTKIDRRNYD